MFDLPEILVLRHGETEWNREGRLQGGLDSPLTPKGLAQAREMGDLLARLGVTSDSHLRLTSPQGRARTTADLAFAALGPATVDDDLREIDVGQWSGLLRTEILGLWPIGRDESMLDFYGRAEGGEGLAGVWDRVGRILDRIDRPAVLVTHGITSRLLRSKALGRGLDRIEEVPGGQGVIHRIADGGHDTLAATDAAPAAGDL